LSKLTLVGLDEHRIENCYLHVLNFRMVVMDLLHNCIFNVGASDRDVVGFDTGMKVHLLRTV